MKREYAALLVLTALLLTAGWNLRRADFLTGQISLSLDRSERAVEREDMDNALIALDNAIELWRGARDYTGVFFRHPDVDAVSDAFFELREVLLRQESEAVPAVLSRLRYHLETLDAMEHLSLRTVF